MIVATFKSAGLLARRFLALPATRKIVLLHALLLVVIIRVSLAFYSLKDLLHTLQRFSRRQAGRRRYSLEDILYATTLFSRRLPFVTCLVNGLAGQYLLARNGYHSTLHIGVKKESDKLLAAHAWVSLDNQVVIGMIDDLHTYTLLFEIR